MQGVSSVAERLVSSQEGLSSMELFIVAIIRAVCKGHFSDLSWPYPVILLEMFTEKKWSRK
jgi:hypothetical protein